MQSPASRFRIGGLKVKHGDIDFESMTVDGHKEIVSQHGASCRPQTASTGVLERLTWLQQRLVSDHTQPRDFFDVTVVILDLPVPGNQLCSHRSRVCDGDGVGKSMDVLAWITVLGQVLRHRFDEKRVFGHAPW